jgi:LysR family transcriptional regulator, low CO2-responsive transcriptional regulator
MNITLHQLRVFRKVAELKSVTKAAKALHMTQPAVSNVLRLLNDALGSPVFDVLNKKIYLTQTGNILLEAGQKIKQTLDETLSKLLLEKGLLTGTLRIATVSTAKYFMLRLLGAFKKEYPDIHMQLSVKNRDEIIERLKHNSDDFVIMSQLPNDLKIEFQPFYEDELVIAASPDHHHHNHHHHHKKKIFTLKNLQHEAWLIREKGSGTRMAMLKLFEKYGFMPRIEMEIDNNESIKQAIISNIGISILSKKSIELEEKVGLIKALDIKEFPVPHEWYLVKHPGKTLSPIAQKFYDFVRTHPKEY